MSSQRIYVAGHRGMVGAAIVRELESHGDCEIITRTHADLDLTDQSAVRAFFAHERIDQIYLAAAKVGGILANSTYPAQFIYENLMIQCNVIHAAHMADVQQLLFLGSSCIYPKFAPQPIPEEALLSGPLEATNEPYAVAKIAGITLCESYNRQYGRDYRCLMPTNLYGPGDNFHPQDAHVIPALMRRFHEAARAGAPTVTIWGSGTPRREFLHVDDLAAACRFVMELPAATWQAHIPPGKCHLNVGTGKDCPIQELAQMLARITGFDGRLIFDTSKPDGTPRKLLDISRITALGWRPAIGFEEGLQKTYAWFVAHQGTWRG